MNSFETVTEALRANGRRIKLNGSKLVAQCPAHNDNNPSLSIAYTDGKVLLTCFAGCHIDEILNSLNLTTKDLFDDLGDTFTTGNVVDMAKYRLDLTPTPQHTPQAVQTPETLEWVYTDPDYNPLIKTIKIRLADGKKTFRQYHYANGQWVNGLGNTQPVLYNLPQVTMNAQHGGITVICEGEKDADTYNQHNTNPDVWATTAPMGAGKWRPEYTETLQGSQEVWIIPDNDKPGLDHANKIIDQLEQANIPWRLLTVNPEVKDLTDHINNGGTLTNLTDNNQLIAQAKSEAAAKALERAIADERIKQQARDTVRKELAESNAADRYNLPTYTRTLTEELNITDEPMPWLIQDLWPANANTTLTATFKAGKTTSIITVIKCLADQQPLFNNPEWQPTDAGRIAFWNYEVSPNQIREWIKERHIKNTDNITLFNMRGTRWPLTTDYAINHTIQWLKDNHIGTWIIDPLARAFVGSGDENSNQDMGLFLDALDYIKDQAGVANLLIAAHTGRNAEQGNSRARGASRFDDWADVRWMLNKDDEDMRFFAADGRDVLVAKGALKYDPETREQTYDPDTRQKNKQQKKNDEKIKTFQQQIAEALREAGKNGLNKTDLAIKCGLTKEQAKGLTSRSTFTRALSTSNICQQGGDDKYVHIEYVNNANNDIK